MNWTDHLPALLLATRSSGHLSCRWPPWEEDTAQCPARGATFVTMVIAFLLWKDVLVSGPAVYVMGERLFNLTMPSG